VKVKVSDDVIEGSFSTANAQTGVLASTNVKGYFYHSRADE
jgi:hypothetical protein